MRKLKEIRVKQAYNHIKGSREKQEVKFRSENSDLGRQRKSFMRNFKSTDVVDDHVQTHVEREDDPYEKYREYERKYEETFGKQRGSKVMVAAEQKENNRPNQAKISNASKDSLKEIARK